MKNETRTNFWDGIAISGIFICILSSGLLRDYLAGVGWIVAFAWFMQYRSTRNELEICKRIKIETALEDYATKNDKEGTGK